MIVDQERRQLTKDSHMCGTRLSSRDVAEAVRETLDIEGGGTHEIRWRAASLEVFR